MAHVCCPVVLGDVPGVVINVVDRVIVVPVVPDVAYVDVSFFFLSVEAPLIVLSTASAVEKWPSLTICG